MTQEEIKENILKEVADNDNLSELNSTSKVAIFNLWAFVISVIAWAQYQLWDIFKAEIDEKIVNQKRFSLLDFRNAALAFRFGHPVSFDANGDYIDDGYTEEEIESAKIVARASAIELEVNTRKNVFIKIAKDDGNDLTALTEAELNAFIEYFAKWKPAGTKVQVITGLADQLKLTISFYYNPLVLDANGVRLDGRDNAPVPKAIRAYLKNLKFNGEFNLTELVNKLEAVDGCSDEVYVRNAEANYLNPPQFETIIDNYVANSGYMTISDTDLQINYIPKNTIL